MLRWGAPGPRQRNDLAPLIGDDDLPLRFVDEDLVVIDPAILASEEGHDCLKGTDVLLRRIYIRLSEDAMKVRHHHAPDHFLAVNPEQREGGVPFGQIEVMLGTLPQVVGVEDVFILNHVRRRSE